MKNIVKEIIYFVVGAIIFMLVYTIWVNPQKISNYFNSIEEKFSESNKVNSIYMMNDTLVNSYIESLNQCEEITKKNILYHFLL